MTNENIKKPNILLIVMDQLALHAVSCYEAPLCKTPHIDSLAQDGIKFERSYTPCALCTPARASLLSGVYPHKHGAIFNSETGHLPFSENELGKRLELYPQKLKEAGYQLGYMGKWHAGLAETANDVGFEGYGPKNYGDVRNSKEYHQYLKEHSLSELETVIEFYAQNEQNKMDSSGYVKGSTEATPSHFIANRTIEMMKQFSEKDSPFFMTCNFWGPHAPYWPSEEYKDLYNPQNIPPWKSFDEDLTNKPQLHRRYRKHVMPNAGKAGWDIWSQVVARYYAQTTMIDAAMGKILNALKVMGHYDDTLLIFTADHGESVGIHGGIFDKGALAYEEIYHTPLIIKMPGFIGAGTTRDHWVSLLDVTATICQATGTSMQDLDGQSLFPIIGGLDCVWRDDMIAQFHGHRFPVSQRILWWKNFKYVLNFADTDELYDLEHDSAELHNLILDSSSVDLVKEMKKRMWNNMKKTGDTLGPQAWTFFE